MTMNDFSSPELEVFGDRAALQALLGVLDEPDPTSTSSRCSAPAEATSSDVDNHLALSNTSQCRRGQ